jgi:hypothetical protein
MLQLWPSLGYVFETLLGCTCCEKAKEGFFMSTRMPNSRPQGSASFRKVAAAFLSGEGLPFAEVLSLATACAMDLAVGPYKGKETGETALLRTMLVSLHPDDIAVMDRYYCSYWTMASLRDQGTQACARKHQRRKSNFGHRP